MEGFASLRLRNADFFCNFSPPTPNPVRRRLLRKVVACSVRGNRSVSVRFPRTVRRQNKLRTKIPVPRQDKVSITSDSLLEDTVVAQKLDSVRDAEDSARWDELRSWADQYKEDAEFWGTGTDPIFTVHQYPDGTVARVAVNEEEIFKRGRALFLSSGQEELSEKVVDVSAKLSRAKLIAKEIESGKFPISKNSSITKFVVESESLYWFEGFHSMYRRSLPTLMALPKVGFVLLFGCCIFWVVLKLSNGNGSKVQLSREEVEMLRRKKLARRKQEELQKGSVIVLDPVQELPALPSVRPPLDKEKLLGNIKQALESSDAVPVERSSGYITGNSRADEKVREIRDMVRKVHELEGKHNCTKDEKKSEYDLVSELLGISDDENLTFAGSDDMQKKGGTEATHSSRSSPIFNNDQISEGLNGAATVCDKEMAMENQLQDLKPQELYSNSALEINNSKPGVVASEICTYNSAETALCGNVLPSVGKGNQLGPESMVNSFSKVENSKASAKNGGSYSKNKRKVITSIKEARAYLVKKSGKKVKDPSHKGSEIRDAAPASGNFNCLATAKSGDDSVSLVNEDKTVREMINGDTVNGVRSYGVADSILWKDSAAKGLSSFGSNNKFGAVLDNSELGLQNKMEFPEDACYLKSSDICDFLSPESDLHRISDMDLSRSPSISHKLDATNRSNEAAGNKGMSDKQIDSHQQFNSQKHGFEGSEKTSVEYYDEGSDGTKCDVTDFREDRDVIDTDVKSIQFLETNSLVTEKKMSQGNMHNSFQTSSSRKQEKSDHFEGMSDGESAQHGTGNKSYMTGCGESTQLKSEESWMAKNFEEFNPLIKKIGLGFRENYMQARGHGGELSSINDLKDMSSADLDDLEWMDDKNLRQIVLQVRENELSGHDPFHQMDISDKKTFFQGLEKHVQNVNEKLLPLHKWIHSKIENLDYGADGISIHDPPEKIIPRWKGSFGEDPDFLGKPLKPATLKNAIEKNLARCGEVSTSLAVQGDREHTLNESSRKTRTLIESSDGTKRSGKKGGKEHWEHTKKWSRGFLEVYNAETDPEVKSVMRDMGKDLDRWLTEKDSRDVAELMSKIPKRRRRYLEKKLDKIKREVAKYGAAAVVSKYREYSDEKEDHLWWLDLNFVLCVELYTVEEDVPKVGFYSLEMAADLELDPKPYHVIAFQDPGDAKNFCYILQSHMETTASGKAFVVAQPPKDAFREAKANGFNVTVIRKGEIKLNVDQTLEEVEDAIVEIGSKFYHDNVMRERSVDIRTLMKGVIAADRSVKGRSKSMLVKLKKS